jgi:hypothetical protein
MRSAKPLLACLFAAAAAAAVGPVAGAKPRPTAGSGAEPMHTAVWPAVAAQLAKNIARDSFAHDYSRVWRYLHPTYQKAVSESRWQRCQRSHPAAPRTVQVTKVSVASATELPVQLSLLGKQNVQEIQVLVQFKTAAASPAQAAILYTFWLKNGSTWTAVWLGEEYAAYKAGKCYVTPQGPPLY